MPADFAGWDVLARDVISADLTAARRTLSRAVGPETRVFLKEELFQRTGSFKPRGALAVMLDLSPEELARGVTAVSAGNHAMAVGYAAAVLGTTAKVVMPKSANPFRVEGCRALGATVELVDDVHQAFARVRQIEQAESRTFVHPFEGPKTALGTATLGLELVEQAEGLDAVIVPIGGGGLCAGVASAVKLASPRTLVFGVEPEGADSMHRSFAAGSPRRIDAVTTIAVRDWHGTRSAGTSTSPSRGEVEQPTCLASSSRVGRVSCACA